MGTSPFAVGCLIAKPEDSSFSIKAQFGNSDRPHRLADLPEQFLPASALLVSFMDMQFSVAPASKSSHLACFTN